MTAAGEPELAIQRSLRAEAGNDIKNKRATMADRTSLGVVGLILAGVTAGVVVVAGWVVNAHLAGRLSLESASIVEVAATRVQ